MYIPIYYPDITPYKIFITTPTMSIWRQYRIKPSDQTETNIFLHGKLIFVDFDGSIFALYFGRDGPFFCNFIAVAY